MSTLSLSDLASPNRMRPPPSSRFSGVSSSIKSQEQGRSNDFDSDSFNVGKRINETMTSMNQMIKSVNAYSNNIGLTAKDITSPKYISKDTYENSPFGKQLILTNYSPYTSSIKHKSNFREDNPHITHTSFLGNLSDSVDSDDNQ